MSPLEVAVAVIIRDGKVLLARRPEGKKHAGLWEFPGGKVEVDESLGEALAREILEELGLAVLSHQELMEIRHRYQDYQVWLRVALVSDFSGVERGLEGQEIAWVAIEKLKELDFPEANLQILDKLSELRL